MSNKTRKLAVCNCVCNICVGPVGRGARRTSGRRLSHAQQNKQLLLPTCVCVLSALSMDSMIQTRSIIIFRGRSKPPGHRFFGPADDADAQFSRAERAKFFGHTLSTGH